MSLRFERYVWLFPAAYALHIVEEYGTGFPAWMTRHMHADMTNQGFLLNNALFMAILLAVTAWASASRSQLSAFVFLCWASGNLFWNFIFHLVTTLYADSYSPGLVSASVLYYPVSLGGAALAVRDGRLGVNSTAGAFAVGGALMLYVVWARLWHFQMP